MLERKIFYPHSRGRVICDACYSTIRAGLMYRRDVWKDGTYHYAIRYCPDCWALLPRVIEQARMDGVWAPHFETWAEDHIDLPEAKAWEARAFPA